MNSVLPTVSCALITPASSGDLLPSCPNRISSRHAPLPFEISNHAGVVTSESGDMLRARRRTIVRLDDPRPALLGRDDPALELGFARDVASRVDAGDATAFRCGVLEVAATYGTPCA